MSLSETSRRRFLGSASFLMGGAALLSPLMSAEPAFAAGGGYKALICLYLWGGCDSHGWLVPTDPDSIRGYRRHRAALSPNLESLLPLTVEAGLESGRSVAVIPQMANVARAFNTGRAAILANIGPLEQPVTMRQWRKGTAVLPPFIGSHVDHAALWQQLAPDNEARFGWGGRLVDQLGGSGRLPLLSAVSVGGDAPFLPGQRISSFNVSDDGNVNSHVTPGSPAERLAARAPQRRNLLVQSVAEVNDRLRDGARALKQAMLPASALPALPEDPSYLTRQLQTVLRIAGAHGGLGLNRQIFYVSTGGYDTHSGQIAGLPPLLSELDQAIGWFDGALAATGLGQQVTLFTASDFGRNLPENGDGTDHGWGAHHLVVGGAVDGGKIYGRLPVIALDTQDITDEGMMLPQISVEQLGATLGRWFGVSGEALDRAFPNLNRFPRRVLPFMRA